ncbi:uncharacterized protein LOC117401156 [Acipenser ruthenus]|uniref:uncharacterized protein LOC117401156 n=1 Tax=Acipenser ruthenus TaxID=7906 RepID=UPI00156135B4|nr:uncharacterized protein LOC117401156 [Acipenser ruthenus]
MPTTRQETSTIDEEVRQLFQGRNVVADRPAQNNSPAFNMQRNFIRAGAVPGILNRRARFEIMVTLHNKLIKPSLERDQKMNGLLLNKIFKDKTVYLRPSLQLLVVPANAKKDRGTLSDDDDDIEIDLTDSSPPMNSLNVTVLQVIEDAPSELIDAPYSTAGSDGPLIITEEGNATVSRIVQVNGSMLFYLLMKSSAKALKIQYPFPLVVKHPTMNETLGIFSVSWPPRLIQKMFPCLISAGITYGKERNEALKKTLTLQKSLGEIYGQYRRERRSRRPRRAKESFFNHANGVLAPRRPLCGTRPCQVPRLH